MLIVRFTYRVLMKGCDCVCLLLLCRVSCLFVLMQCLNPRMLRRVSIVGFLVVARDLKRRKAEIFIAKPFTASARCVKNGVVPAPARGPTAQETTRSIPQTTSILKTTKTATTNRLLSFSFGFLEGQETQKQPHSQAHNHDLVFGSRSRMASLSHQPQASPPPRTADLSGGFFVFSDGGIDEDHHPGPPKKRFRVPDVVSPEFDRDGKAWLSCEGDESSSVLYLSEGYVRDNVRGERVLSLNSRWLFDFDHMKGKSEGGNWEESFRGHADKRPFGPQSISFDVSFHDAKFVYGIPEHATSLALNPTRGPGVDEFEPYRLFNPDVFEFLHESPFGLYGSIPFVISHGKSRGISGFFWLNSAQMQIDVLGPWWAEDSGIAMPSLPSVDTFWMSEAGVVVAFFFVGPGPKDVVRQYTSVTGRPSMPQLFAMAYHQCRWNYLDEEDVHNVDARFDEHGIPYDVTMPRDALQCRCNYVDEEDVHNVDARFDEHDIPYDVLWLDVEHTDGKRYFTWDMVNFPHPEDMQKRLAAKERHTVTVVDPHIKRDGNFFLHKEPTEKGYYIKDVNGNDYDGWCWPGSSSYLDVLNPEIRSWWNEKFSYENYVGLTQSLYIWNNLNEPSVFNDPEVTMPMHFGGVEHREVHNVYGLYFHMATEDGLVKRGNGNDRPSVLSRAFFAGSQRYGAVWTGNNTADWEQLRVSVPMVLTLGLTGISFSGADIGSFFGNPETKLSCSPRQEKTRALVIQRSFRKIMIQIDRVVRLGGVAGEGVHAGARNQKWAIRNLEIEFQWSNK